MADTTSLELRSLVKSDGIVELSLARVPVPTPADDEVIVRIEATPINPSDIGLLLASADIKALKGSGSGTQTVLTAPISPAALRALTGRLDKSMPVGNEGAGVVASTGASPKAQSLLGKTVSIFGGAMYAQYRKIKAADCLVLPDDATPKDGAAAFVNPITALGMVETMRAEGHKGLVHTAAASNLGKILNRICLAENVPLVNIVRGAEQVEILKRLGAKHVVDSTQSSFGDDLVMALRRPVRL